MTMPGLPRVPAANNIELGRRRPDYRIVLAGLLEKQRGCQGRNADATTFPQVRA